MNVTVTIDIKGTLDPDQLFFVLCMENVHLAKDFKSFDQFIGQTESLVERMENMGIQRMAEEVAE